MKKYKWPILRFYSGCSLRRNRTSGRKGGREQRAFAGRSCGPLRFLTGTANSRFKIRWGCRAVCIPIRAAACGELARCGPAGRELRASTGRRLRPAAPYGRKYMIQNSRFKIRWGCRAVCIPIRAAACGELARCGPAGRELRASTGRRLRPAAPVPGANS